MLNPNSDPEVAKKEPTTHSLFLPVEKTYGEDLLVLADRP
jgi:hypothetical protein